MPAVEDSGHPQLGGPGARRLVSRCRFRVRRRTGLGGRFVIGFVGRLSPAKGAADFVRAAGNIASRLPEGHVGFLMVGDGP